MMEIKAGVSSKLSKLVKISLVGRASCRCVVLRMMPISRKMKQDAECWRALPGAYPVLLGFSFSSGATASAGAPGSPVPEDS